MLNLEEKKYIVMFLSVYRREDLTLEWKKDWFVWFTNKLDCRELLCLNGEEKIYFSDYIYSPEREMLT